MCNVQNYYWGGDHHKHNNHHHYDYYYYYNSHHHMHTPAAIAQFTIKLQLLDQGENIQA
jgi:hypothetical protein